MNGEIDLSGEGPFVWPDVAPLQAIPEAAPEHEGPFERSELREARGPLPPLEPEASAEPLFSAAEVCPQEPIPAGWHSWGAARAPKELEAIAVELKNHIDDFPYGQVVRPVQYNGRTVGFFKSHHTWTYRGGKRIDGILHSGDLPRRRGPDPAARARVRARGEVRRRVRVRGRVASVMA